VTDLGEIVRERLAAKAREGRRPTQAEIVWLELTQERAAPSSSVEISRNAKGDMQFTLKIADPDPLVALATAKDIADHLRAVYPMANGTVGSPSKDVPPPKVKPRS